MSPKITKRVTTIAKGNTHGVSADVLIRVLVATSHRAEIRVKKAAAQSQSLPSTNREGPEEVRDEFTAIPAERIEEACRQPSVK